MSPRHLKTMDYANYGGQTMCIMGNVKMVNVNSCVQLFTITKEAFWPGFQT